MSERGNFQKLAVPNVGNLYELSIKTYASCPKHFEFNIFWLESIKPFINCLVHLNGLSASTGEKALVQFSISIMNTLFNESEKINEFLV